MRQTIRLIRYEVAWWRWFLRRDVIAGDPALGATREERNRNINLMWERKLKREPKIEDF